MAERNEAFGSYVFSDRVMRERLPEDVYRRLRETVEEGTPLDSESAEVIAGAMKDWAIERGATHYTHWFSPMNGQTAEKHEAFVSPMQDGTVIFEFTGKALARGETDASSFPSGGLRATFEARGYTAWDCVSPAFIRKDPGGVIALCIPTVFSGFNGEALDTRIPLVRSMTALNRAALRVLRALGDTSVRRVLPYVGLEQEYFLIDRQLYKERRDLIYTGRTLFGAKPPKGQEMDDQYYAAIRQRVSGFMAELNDELWRLGVPAKTQHNEAAPAQHEVAVVYDSAVAACDQNHLTMMLLRKVAARRGLACLLHEKPFAGFSGSGKHINWSLGTESGKNLLDPGKDPPANERFMLFFMAAVAGFHQYADLLRVACAGLSNDYRLGGLEAPTPVISVFIGPALHNLLIRAAGRDDLSVTQGEAGLKNDAHHGASGCDSDRNRTSAIAFTGNKFEFRMPGASQSGSWISAMMNTVVADRLSAIASRLEAADDVKAESRAVIGDLLEKHGAVLFDGDSYSASWMPEAIRRGLPCLPSTTDAIPVLERESTIAVLTQTGVLSRTEIESRIAVHWDTYIKRLRIEAQTLLDIQSKQILPAALAYRARCAREVYDT
ncbi:MAG: glutamine synthetase III, partial [Clostridia bacterium]|nr:glutamine synthetase III [Clostridia bacterium]